MLKWPLTEWQLGMQEQNGWNAIFWKQSAKMLATCIHMLRGTPYIYQGEELGMTNPGYRTIEEYRNVESTNYYKILLQKGKKIYYSAARVIAQEVPCNGTRRHMRGLLPMPPGLEFRKAIGILM